MLHLQILVSVFVVFSWAEEIRASCPNQPSLLDKVDKDTKLRWHSMYEIPVLTPYQCADACLRDTRCKSFNFKRKQNSDDVNLCEINDIKWTDDTDPGVVSNKPGTDLYNVGFQRLHQVSVLHWHCCVLSLPKAPILNL